MRANRQFPQEHRIYERIASHCICCNSIHLIRSPAILMPFVANRVFGWEPVEITDDWGLRDIRLGMAYPLCNSVQCFDCGVLFLDIRFTESEMSSLYSGYRENEYVALRERFEPGYKIRNQIILNGSNYTLNIEQFLLHYMLPPSTVLDWGGDTGLNTPFKSQCKLLHIYDISSKPLIGNAIRLDRNAIDHIEYDLIVFSHVLEHVPFPLDLLSEIRSVMKKNTMLYLEIPHEDIVRLNPDSRELYKLKKHWHEHINFFTQESINCLLDLCNLCTIGIETIKVSAGGKDGYVFIIVAKARDS